MENKIILYDIQQVNIRCNSRGGRQISRMCTNQEYSIRHNGEQKILFCNKQKLSNRSSSVTISVTSSNINGNTGNTGPTGSTGPIGYTGPTGPTGLQGIQGYTGYTGPIGLRGIRGSPGIYYGYLGPRGPTGMQGSRGYTGDTGPSGIRGDRGDRGYIGYTGPTGLQGSDGSRGSQGNTGPTGIQGSRGDRGYIGDTGPTGLQGERGIQGDTGHTGPTGLQGIQGYIGNIGYTGPTGLQGIQGYIGTTGPTGLQGIRGNIGHTGPSGRTGSIGATSPDSILILVTGSTNISGYISYSSLPNSFANLRRYTNFRYIFSTETLVVPSLQLTDYVLQSAPKLITNLTLPVSYTAPTINQLGYTVFVPFSMSNSTGTFTVAEISTDPGIWLFNILINIINVFSLTSITIQMSTSTGTSAREQFVLKDPIINYTDPSISFSRIFNFSTSLPSMKIRVSRSPISDAITVNGVFSAVRIA